ncbi:carbohydrate binding domain-containing protein [Prosthecobacter sp. SYSU 5D2]|uniref:carbohydrate binding domain-containing protein n=1 Tax=Prosthecobacter sp. SYSU 5D2 TaxID=3134134 RepID=UPI0031FF188C
MNKRILIQTIILCFGALSFPAYGQGAGRPNLLSNSDFKEGLNGWNTSSDKNIGKAELDHEVKRGDTPSVRITNPSAGDTFCKQTVKVKPGMRYRLTGYIKSKDVEVKGAQAANLSLAGGYERSKSLKGSESWQKVEFEFDSKAVDTLTVGCRLGGWYSPASGTAWFDDLKLIEVGKSRK